jgi:sulfite reductase (NADPH) hemoprotein beta-component/sulfite reductase (ferredoxin)
MTLSTLDLTGVACPINFVRTKLKLETMALGDQLQVTLDDGEPIESVAKSILEEGQQIASKQRVASGAWELLILKCC